MPSGIYGRKPFTDKHRENMGKARIGHIVSIETRKKISKANKGHPKWFFRHSEKTKEKLSKILKGKHLSLISEFKKGHKISEKIREKISISQSKRMTSEIRKRISEMQKGRKLSDKTKRKMSEAHKGKKAWNWKEGISKVNDAIRKNSDHKWWSKQILKKDNYICFLCGQYGVKKNNRLIAHHLLSWGEFIDLRWEIRNGICLCKKCHIKLHKRLRQQVLLDKNENLIK